MKLNTYDYQYYFDFNIKNWYYRIWYIPGDIVDLTGSSNICPLPKGCIQKGLQIEGNLPDDLPGGMVESYIMNLKINLAYFEGIYKTYINPFDETDYDYIDLGELRQSIVNGVKCDGSGNPEYYTFLSVTTDITIPNRWVLLSNDGAGTASYTKIEFHGIQDIKPKKKFDYNEIWDLTLIDIHTSCLKLLKGNSVPFTLTSEEGLSLIPDVGVAAYGQSVYDNIQISANFNLYVANGGSQGSNDRLTMLQFVDYFEDIDAAKTLIYRFYMRTAFTTFTKDYTNNTLSHIQFYKQTFDLTGAKSTALNNNELYFGAYYSNNWINAVGGEYDPKNETSVKNELGTIKDLLAQWTDGNCCKSIIKYDLSELSSNTNYLVFYKILDQTNGAVKTLTSRQIDKKTFSIESGEKIPNQATATIKTAENDINTFTEKSIGLIQEQSEESQVLFHNLASLGNIGSQINTSNTTDVQLNFGYSARKIYYEKTPPTPSDFDASYLKVDDDCSINLGSHDGVDSDVIISSSGYTDTRYPMVSAWQEDHKNEFPKDTPILGLKLWYKLYRYAYLGLPRMVAKAKKYLFSNRNNAFINCIVPIEYARLEDLGHTYNIDSDTILGTTYLTPPYSTKAILTNVKIDVYEGKSTCKFWLRGF